MKKLLLLLRVSNPQYNMSLYRDHVVYMNPQLSFGKSGLLRGQLDMAEGSLFNSPVQLYYSIDDRKSWKHVAEAKTVRIDNSAYIYCMYGVTYNIDNYDKLENKYYCNVPWEYIRDVWQDGYELMVIKNTPTFINSLLEAATHEKLPCAYGLINYDLQERQNEEDYISTAVVDPFLSSFHKIKNPYSIQKEFRFVVNNINRPDHYELHLLPTAEISVSLIRLKHGRDILIELSDLKFDKNGFPVSFSPNIVYYESDLPCNK